MNVKILDVKPQVGDIIGIKDYDELIFGIYLGYTQKEVEFVKGVNIKEEVLYKQDEILDRLYTNSQWTLYRLGTIELDTTKDFYRSNKHYALKDIAYDSNIAEQYITAKVQTFLNTPFSIHRLVYEGNNAKTCIFDISASPRETLTHWLLKSSLVENLKGFYFISDEEFKDIIRSRIISVFKKETSKYSYYDDFMSICTLIDRESLNCGEIYVCNKHLKNQKTTKVLMMYLGNDKFVQIGTSREFEQEPVNLIKSIQKNIDSIAYLDYILDLHYIVDISYDSEIYEIKLDNITLTRPQRVKRVQRNKLDRNNLEELKNEYIRG